MKKLNKVAMLFASAALVAPLSSAFAQVATGGDNWRSVDGTVWKNGTNEYCWRDNFWTPATAAINCDGAAKPGRTTGDQRASSFTHAPSFMLR